jgi:hypothetical protein
VLVRAALRTGAAMSTKSAVVLERLLPAFDPLKNNPKIPLLAPVITLHPSNEQIHEEEVEEGEWDDEQSYHDGWLHYSADCIEYCVRLCNLEIDYYAVELSRTNDPQCIKQLRLNIIKCMDERDRLIIEHTHLFAEHTDKLRDACRTRISKHLNRDVCGYDVRAADSPKCGEREDGGNNVPSPSAGKSTGTMYENRTKQNKKKKSRPISLKVVYRQNSFICTFTPGVKHPKG